MPQSAAAVHRNVPVDAAKTAAIFGTLLIHASAAGGFVGGVGSFQWTANLFWNTLIRCAVPVFFLCSGSLLLPPEKAVTIRTVWRRYIPRIAAALFFWAAAYSGWSLLLVKHRTGIMAAAAIRQALVDLLLFRHKTHLYYLHMTLLVYAVLPLTRLFVEKADRLLMSYALGAWFVLGSVAALIAAVCGGPLWLQLVLFFAVSVAALAATRPLVTKLLKKDIKPTNADRALGAVGRVTERIDNALPSGAVYIDGKTWTARSADGEVIEPDAAVRILRMEGVKLIVQKEQ